MKPNPAEFISVSVPVAALPMVHETLDRYYKSVAARQVERVSVPNNGEWSRDEVLSLHREFRNAAGRAVMKLIAERADKKVSYEEMAKAAGISFNELRAQLAWLSRYAVKVKGAKVWPMSMTENSQLPTGQRYQYRMDKIIAQWWLEAEAAAGGGQ